MKKVFLAAACALLLATGFAQSTKFTTAMKTNLAAMDSAFRNPQNLLSLSNSFERIATAEKDQWLPYYYAAFTQVNYAFMQTDMTNSDPIADRAAFLLNKADSLSPNNSEISCLKSMIATVRMLVNPQQRYMEFAPEIEKQLEAAKKQDPTNPRPYYLKGENLKNTPEQFGGGCQAAKLSLTTAKEKYLVFKPASEIAPSWGLERLNQVLADCKF